MRLFVGFVLLMWLVACSSSPVPKGLLQPDKMYPVVKDMIQADEYINNYVMSDSTINIKERRSLLYAKVFKLHNTTREQYYNSYDFYRQHPDLLKTLFDSLALGLKKPEYKKAVAIPLPGDSLLQ